MNIFIFSSIGKLVKALKEEMVRKTNIGENDQDGQVILNFVQNLSKMEPEQFIEEPVVDEGPGFGSGYNNETVAAIQVIITL